MFFAGVKATSMLTDVTVEEVEQTDQELCHVRVHVNIDGNDESIDILFKQEDAATLVVDSDNVTIF